MKKFTEQILDTLKEGVEIHGTPYKLSKASGVQLSTLGRWLEGTPPRLASVEPVLNLLQAQIVLPGQSVRDYARFLQIDASDAYQHHDALAKGQDVPISVLEYAEQTKPVQPEILFSLEILANLGVDAADGLLYKVQNDVMPPLINSGDLLLIDRSFTEIRDGKLYLFHVDGRFLVRRASRNLKSEIVLHGSADMPTLYVTPEVSSAVTNLGQVVWIGKSLV